ncbi:MAG: GIY-YIG nuclease family protein [Selenomonadaceae bacterium]|nr:GIY-YIG nuclease family protein [Selenomonadaceae bacterium]
MEPYGIIYLLIDGTNDLEYVGQTTKTFEERFKGHLYGDQYIDRVIRKRGVDMFATAILKVCYSQEELDYWERHFIKSRNTMAPNGYNCTSGGEGGPLCEETKARISEANIRRFSDPEERAKQAERTRKSFEDPERAAKHSEGQRRRFERQEERDKIAAAVTERFSDPTERAAQSERIKKAFQKPGVSESISARQKKRFEDPAEHEKVSVGLKKYYEEHPEAALAISARNKGRQDSDETRERKSLGQKARQARLRLERLPEMIAKQNLVAAKWKPLPIDLKNCHHEHPEDIEKIFAEAKRLKEQRRSARRRAKARLSIATE